MTDKNIKLPVLKSFLFVAILVCFVCSYKAQVPGYMGKRVSAGYGFYFNPAFNTIVSDYGNSPINTLHEFFLEVASGKKVSLGASAMLYRYTYNNVDLVNLENYVNSYYSERDVRPTGSYDIRGTNFRLYAKFFKSWYVAPWGKYFTTGITINKYETTYRQNQMRASVITQEYSSQTNSYVQTQYTVTDFGPLSQTFRNVDVFFGNGNSRIFSNKIIFDYGYTVNVIAMSRNLLTILDSFEYNAPSEYIKNTSADRVAAVNRFNFYFKLGYLF